MAAIMKEWRIDLMQARARLFDLMPDDPERSFGYPNCKEGWRDILERLCTRIENALGENETFEFVRIRQKFGGLRIDWEGEVSDHSKAKIREAVDLAVARSTCICEVCGAVGRLYINRNWLATGCAEHGVGDPVPDRPGFENLLRVRLFNAEGRPTLAYRRYDRETDTLSDIMPRPSGTTE